jgi:ribosomal protein L11 methyltransferase
MVIIKFHIMKTWFNWQSIRIWNRLMNYFCFELNYGANSDEIWELLTSEGYQLLYSEEEFGQPAKLYGYPPLEAKELHPAIAAVKKVDFDAIDWRQQWIDAGGDESGIITLELNRYFPGNGVIRLEPGPGFGDFSHPTTRLVLELMIPLLKGRNVLDVGSGSGILSLAAMHGGALAVHGIDIDEDAIQHANKNALNNDLQDKVTFGLPEQPFGFGEDDAKWLIVMNMISSEQKVAWKSVAPKIKFPCDIVTSGVLKEEQEEYLVLAHSWGWVLVCKSEDQGWSAFHFRASKS